MASLTKHARKRMKTRFGASKKKSQVIAEQALAIGMKAEQFKGAFRRYLDDCHPHLGNPDARIRVHQEHVFLFGGGNQMVTVLPMPKRWAATWRSYIVK